MSLADEMMKNNNINFKLKNKLGVDIKYNQEERKEITKDVVYANLDIEESTILEKMLDSQSHWSNGDKLIQTEFMEEYISMTNLKYVNYDCYSINGYLGIDNAKNCLVEKCRIKDCFYAGNHSENVILDNYVELIKHIIAYTDMNVCLIPHVVWSYNDDFKPINTLYEMFKDTGRVIKLEDHNCEELKGYISRCRFFVGARTHATIAAYSTCVPTLVVGYSVKSKGIARDLFGTDENYVIPVQSMNNQNDLKNAFDYIYKNEKEIKSKLTTIMPEYKEKALIGASEIRKLIG